MSAASTDGPIIAFSWDAVVEHKRLVALDNMTGGDMRPNSQRVASEVTKDGDGEYCFDGDGTTRRHVVIFG